MSMKRLHPLVITGALVFSPLVWAAGSATATEEPSIQSLSPAEVASGALTPHVQGGVRFVSGGIGIEERAWLAKHGGEYNTHLTFALVPSGGHLEKPTVLSDCGVACSLTRSWRKPAPRLSA